MRFRGTGLVLDAGIDVLGVLPEDNHVAGTGVFHRRGHALEPAHRAQAGIQVQFLAQGDIEGPETAAHGGGQGALDGDDVFLDGGQGLFRKPVALVQFGGLLAGVYFHPGNLAGALVGLVHGGVDHVDHHRADIDTDAVPLDIGDNRIFRDVQAVVVIDGDFVTLSGYLNMLVAHSLLHCCC